MNNTVPSIKIVGIVDEDPFSYKTWSGSSRYFFSALQEKNILLNAFATEPNELIKYLYKIASFRTSMREWKLKYHLHQGFFRQRTKVALKRLEAVCPEDFNVVLQIGAWYDLPGKTDKLTVSYHDGNLSTMVNTPGRNLSYDYPFVHACLKYEKHLYSKMDCIFTMSKWLASSFINDFGVDPGKVESVGAGINLPFINKIEEKSYDAPNVLFVGKMFERKGGRYLLNAFKKVRKEIPNATLTIIGPELKQLPEGVNCLGFIPKNDENGIQRILDEYTKASLFVLPSIYEPFGIVFAEAMAHKLPCIGTDNCAMPELIIDGSTGFTVPACDSDALANKMIELLKSPEIMLKMGTAGYHHYLQNFTWEKVAEKIKNRISIAL